MSARPIPIFYEDDWGAVREFGLHELIVSCVADERDESWWDLRARFEPIPKKGDANLLAACRDEVPNMTGAPIFALFDADKLHKRLFTSGRPSNEELLAELRNQCPDDRLHMFLIDKNTETMVDAVADCLGVDRPQKDKLLRDRLLNRAARETARKTRDCTREAVPSFDACVRAIAKLSS